ncbi:YlbE-like family protein [Desertibacillus haloalkaliphilus]|uniref:YlbE-like family protein n=1 Tax=Desertibacillus haloalkaliphilus TaxID=1328930 RepID=UPI001C27F69E|nr:YlbE-like family protein [Desertibacillus haloalkaliphilus]MBU8907142.1 YlbE-like family protein [Desertibacillus haloalkaliphilus]
MRRDVQTYLQTRPDLKRYLREQPIWYRRLSRDPRLVKEMEREANYFYGKTIPQRMERFQSNINMVMMLLEFLRSTSEPNHETGSNDLT